jgi:type IV pilus assembly protein PilE
MKAGRQKGVTLIELMVTVMIIAILAAIAMPAYQEYVRRGHRGAAKAQMLDLAIRQQQLLLANRAYTAMDAAACAATLPPEVSARYGCTVTLGADAVPSFTITFTPTGPQASDGTLVLNSVGLKTRAGDAAKW